MTAPIRSMPELIDAALESEDGFEAYCARQSMMKSGPFVRASTYASVTYQQDIWRRDFGDDPRRPVVMKGAIELRKQRYARKSAWAEIIADRYLKIIRFCCFRREEADIMERILWRHMERRGHYVHRPLDMLGSVFCGMKEAAFYVDGQHRWGSADDWRNARRFRAPSIIIKRKKFELRATPTDLPPVVLKHPEPPTPRSPLAKLSISQRRQAAYLALKEIGIDI